MLTAQEVQIEINQIVQKFTSNAYDDFLPEEIDWIYNKVRDRFILSCVRPKADGSGGFQINEAYADYISTIIKRNVELTTYKEKVDEAYSMLPGNYSYLLNDRSYVLSDCSDSFTANTTSHTEYIGKLLFSNSPKTTAKYYDTFNIVLNGTTIFDINNYNISAGLNAKNEKFVLIHLVLEVLRRDGINVYWERYRNTYERDTFIIVSSTQPTGSIIIDTLTNILQVSSSSLQVFNSTFEKEVPNRLTKTTALPDVKSNNVFHKPIPNSPVTTLADNKLYVFYSEKRFIVNKLIIDYVRKPQKLSLILNNSCELPEIGVLKCCELAGEYIKNIIESPAYQSKLQDNIVRME